jgi:mRNA-degrading endonuclease toxin of MazEF toxin-antitoxin module
MSLDTGDVVWHEAPFKSPRPDGSQPDRPWLVVSNDSHPFHGREYIVLGMTTNPRSEGLRVRAAD